MRKIGIVTLNGYFNYGNRLQNYALQEVLIKYDANVSTILIDSEKETKKRSIQNSMRKIINPKYIIRKVYKQLYIKPLNNKRSNRIKRFSNKYIKETSGSISENNLYPEMLNEYDYFVTGSDQVWNPYYAKSTSLYFLTFAPKEKRIAFSPSFGISKLPEWCKKDYKQWLNDIEHLSVREDAGASLIKELTERDAEVLPDPTLLLAKEEWLSIAKPASNKPKQEYLLTYFLGSVPEETKKIINNISKIYNLKIINLAQPRQKEFYLTDPAEFLDFINSATVFFTDSFHGSVFSILFETPFIVTDRNSKVPSMNSRINTLLSTYKLEDRHISSLNYDNIFDVDFSHVEEILKNERNKANIYLRKALNG